MANAMHLHFENTKTHTQLNVQDTRRQRLLLGQRIDVLYLQDLFGVAF
jgi:hypothetical protein